MKKISGNIYFNEESFKNICQELENNNQVEIHIDCIGFTKNNVEQEIYKEELEEKYKDRLKVTKNDYTHHYTYSYEL